MIRSRYFLFWGLSFVLVIAIAFAPRYWIPVFEPEVEISQVIHFHALFATLWIVLYVSQVSLIRARKITTHRVLGFVSLIIVIGVLISGFYVSLGLAERALVVNPQGARPLLLVNILDLMLFGVLIGFAIKYRKKAIRHKQFVTLGTIVLMNAAYFRLGRFIVGQGLTAVILAVVITSLVILLFLWSGKKYVARWNSSIRRVALIIIAIHVVRIPLAITPIWSDIADYLLATF